MLRTKICFIVLCIMYLASCEDSSFGVEQIPAENELTNSDDPEMEEAIMLAETYLAEIEFDDSQARKKGKKGDDNSYALTMLRFKNDELQYKTSRRRGGYKTIDEASVTAKVALGEYVFWSAGGQLSDLDGIEFDSESQLQLVDAPEEVKAGKMWVIKIAEEDIDDDGFLKYDILYRVKTNGEVGPLIRLDPKIKIQR